MEGFKIFTIVDKMPSILQSTRFDFAVTCIFVAKLCWEHRLTRHVVAWKLGMSVTIPTLACYRIRLPMCSPLQSYQIEITPAKLKCLFLPAYLVWANANLLMYMGLFRFCS